jgi:hypothetical protein
VRAAALAAHRRRSPAEMHRRGTREHGGSIPFVAVRGVGGRPWCASHDPGSGVGARWSPGGRLLSVRWLGASRRHVGRYRSSMGPRRRPVKRPGRPAGPRRRDLRSRPGSR